MTKSERHTAIRNRARKAIQALYHNATPRYPVCATARESEAFDSWFEAMRDSEIDYLQSGGAYGHDYRATLQADCNAGRFKSPAARAYYVRKGLEAMRQDRAHNAWEEIGESGPLFTYGRGGRTLAPAWYMRNSGSSPNLNRAGDGNMIACVEDIRRLESFNAYVAQWCASIPEMWAEYWAEHESEVSARYHAAV